MGSEAARFRRDRTTLLAYSALAAYTYCLYALGPMLAFLRDELHLSYTVTSLHSSLWAGGTVLTGLTFTGLARLLGRQRLFWLSAAGTALGLLLLMLAHAVALTLLASAWIGTWGTVLQTGCLSVLSDRHGERRDRAFVEATIGGSAAAVLAPLLLGAAQRTEAGWRAGFLLPLVTLGILYLLFRRDALPGQRQARSAIRRRLPGSFWPLALLVSAVVGLEFCIVFYAPQLLKVEAGLQTAQAAAVLSVFYLGELAGRTAGGGLTRRPGRAPALSTVGLALTSSGVLALWLSGLPWLAIPGLLLAGLGVANLYPLTLSLALGAAEGLTDLATARVQLLTGVAVIAAPLVLGRLADAAGVLRAFALVPLLIAVSLMLVLTFARAPSPLRSSGPGA